MLDFCCSPEVNKQFSGKLQCSADPNMSICCPWNSLIHQRFPSVCSICSLQSPFYFSCSSDLPFGHKKLVFKTGSFYPRKSALFMGMFQRNSHLIQDILGTLLWLTRYAREHEDSCLFSIHISLCLSAD